MAQVPAVRVARSVRIGKVVLEVVLSRVESSFHNPLRVVYNLSMKLEPKTKRPHPEMHEGAEAFDRFRQAVKAVLRVPKSAMPPSPFSKKKS